MKIKIRKYKPLDDYDALMKIIKSEGDEWKDYLKPSYKELLEQSITYVAIYNDVLCGYVRSINDGGVYIWVIDLLVDKSFRGNAIGKKLMDQLLKDFPDCDVYVLSDVDEYYNKLSYTKEGSVFKVS